MISFTRSYKTEDGQVFGTIEEAQTHELTVALDKHRSDFSDTNPAAAMAKILLKDKNVILDILTMTPNSKPKARAIHGGSKKRTPKTVVTDANTSVTAVTTNAAV